MCLTTGALIVGCIYFRNFTVCHLSISGYILHGLVSLTNCVGI